MSEQYSGHMIVDLMNIVNKVFSALVIPTPSQGLAVAIPPASPATPAKKRRWWALRLRAH
jgi:hypothetical protein